MFANSGDKIILVMSEAFWDPTLLKEVSFSQDPLPYFYSLQQTQTSGVMLSPVYGGGTANTEFEVLTGVFGDGRAIIGNAGPSKQATIEILGENFSYNHIVYVNGQAVKTDLSDILL